ncbi:hypothetical protein NM208_g11603 [Fusarium decemcellulare]|uniref:Uncharacterized protein n=1 Tax=Fusarium decemcellulare TaxID=57161 RepID=A0ACC1RU65_9HYPO|nr:hypothetical protein NM208_g11603 [Fusarium decemcellulare]
MARTPQKPLRFKPHIRRSDPRRLEFEMEDYARNRRQDMKEACESGFHEGHTKFDCPVLPHPPRRPKGFRRRHTKYNYSRPTRPSHRTNAYTTPRDCAINPLPETAQEQPKYPIFPVYHCPGMSSLIRETQGAGDNYNYPTPSIKFPDLRASFVILLKSLQANTVEGLQTRGYDSAVKRWGIDEITDAAMRQVEPEVLELQGKILSPETFLRVQERQSRTPEAWPQIGGYVDGVTDRRFPNYIRFYVGQSFQLPIRLSIDHAKGIRNGYTRYLHYFVLARGHGNRFAHFLRLWSSRSASDTPPHSESNSHEHSALDTDRLELLQNILEMTFCRRPNYSNVGLNVMSPLVQGKNVPAIWRAKFLEYHLCSPDPDISEFVDIRKNENIKRRNQQRQAAILLRRDYRRAIIQLATELGFDSSDSFLSFAKQSRPSNLHDIDVKFQETEEALAAISQGPTLRQLCRPRGNHQALIGIIFGSDLMEVEYDGHAYKPLDGLELRGEDSLTWTTSFEEVGSGSGPTGFNPGSYEDKLLGRLNRSIIMESGLRVVVLCGLRAQTDIQRAFNHPLQEHQLSGPHHLILGNQIHEVWFLISGQAASRQTIEKLFIACPEPIITSYLKDTSLMRSLRDVFGLVSTLTEVKLRSNCWTNHCFHAALVAQLYFEERQRAVPLTTTSLGAVFRDWLYYRGFKDDADILELEKTAENLTKGIQIVRNILCVWARQGGPRTTRRQDDAVRANERKVGANFKNYQKVQELFSRLYSERVDSIKCLTKTLGNSHSIGSASLDDEEPIEQPENDDVLLGHNEESLEKDPLTSLWLALPEDDDAHDIPQRGRSYGKSREKLSRMLTDNGVEIKAGLMGKVDRCYIDIHQRLVTLVIPAEGGVDFKKRPTFAIRAQLTPTGVPHPNCVLGELDEFISTDPSLRLAIEYRLVDDGTGRLDRGFPWHFGRLGNANTEHLGIERRDVSKWGIKLQDE